jgi:hypothetical protein
LGGGLSSAAHAHSSIALWRREGAAAPQLLLWLLPLLLPLLLLPLLLLPPLEGGWVAAQKVRIQGDEGRCCRTARDQAAWATAQGGAHKP